MEPKSESGSRHEDGASSRHPGQYEHQYLDLNQCRTDARLDSAELRSYIVDTTGGPSFTISAEIGPDGSSRSVQSRTLAWTSNKVVTAHSVVPRDMQRLIPALYLVDNNGPTSIGGGGTPLQPLALPLQLPVWRRHHLAHCPPVAWPAPRSPCRSICRGRPLRQRGRERLQDLPQTARRSRTTSFATYADAGLLPLTLYSYAVAAYDAAGNTSAQSAVVSRQHLAASDTQLPTVPTGLVGTAVSSSQINLSWTASTDNVGVTGYYVYLNGRRAYHDDGDIFPGTPD